MKATIREWLNGEGFDWERGLIVYHETSSPEDRAEGYESSPGRASKVGPGVLIDHDHPILDHEFPTGYGGPMCPRFFARDDHAIYFPGQYDGATWCEKIVFDITAYLGDDAVATPYPGG